MSHDPTDDPETESYLESDAEHDTEELELPITEVLPRFNAEEERYIEVQLEVKRRFRHENQFTESDVEPMDDTPVFEGEYPATRKNILSFFASSIKRMGQGILLVVVIWALWFYAPTALFDIQPGSETSWNVGFITAGVTIVTLIVIFLLEIKNFMLWKNWRLEVTEAEVIITQSKSIIGRIDEMRLSLRRSSVETVRTKRKWYLSFLNIYTVSFDAPGDQDTPFHDMKYVMNGKLLKKLFTKEEE